MKLVGRDDSTSGKLSSSMSNDNEEFDDASDSDTPARPSQPHLSPDDDDIDSAHFPHEHEALYESRDEESSSSKNNNTSYHDNES